MTISTKGEYALAALFDLALGRPGEPVKIASIARRRRIPQKFLELILANLRQGGFVRSRRGAEGGYVLARPPESITVGEVLRFVEGARPRAEAKDSDPFGEMWERVEQGVSKVVDRTTFADVASAWKERQSRFVLNWEI